MKLRVFVFFILVFLSCQGVIKAKCFDVDSLFKETISSLESHLEDDDCYVFIDDIENVHFLEALIYLTDIHFFKYEYHHYNPMYSKEELERLRKLYMENYKLIVERIGRVYELRDSVSCVGSIEELEVIWSKLDSLNIDKYK